MWVAPNARVTCKTKGCQFGSNHNVSSGKIGQNLELRLGYLFDAAHHGNIDSVLIFIVFSLGFPKIELEIFAALC